MKQECDSLRIRYPLLTANERIARAARLSGIGPALPNVVCAGQTTPAAALMSPTERLLAAARHYHGSAAENRSMLWLLAHGANAAAVTPGEPHFGALGLLYDQGYSSDGFESGRLQIGPDQEVVAALLRHRANPNTRDKTGRTPLHVACYIRDRTNVASLLKAHADPNIPDKDGATPLMTSVNTFLARDLVRDLVKHHSRVNQTDKKGRTALMYAAESGSCEPGVVRFLIKHGAKLNARSREGLTALDYAEEFISASKETAAIKNMLRKFGGKPGATTK